MSSIGIEFLSGMDLSQSMMRRRLEWFSDPSALDINVHLCEVQFGNRTIFQDLRGSDMHILFFVFFSCRMSNKIRIDTTKRELKE